MLIIGLTFIMGVLLWEYYHLRMSEVIKSGQVRQESVLKIQKKTFATNIKSMFIDMWELTNRPLFEIFLEAPTEDNLELIEVIFSRYLKSKPKYEQIRLIDLHGHEMVRVERQDDGSTKIVAKEDLQYKGKRYYYENALTLDKDQLYISQVDLNVENNEIELPYNPTMRFSTPIRDAAGRIHFVLVINISADNILGNVELDREILLGEENELTDQAIINKDGFYLTHEDDSKLWGFLIPGREDDNFFLEYPNFKDQIVDQKSGTILTNNGIVTFIEVDPEVIIESLTEDHNYKFNFSSSLNINNTQKYYIVNKVDTRSYTKNNKELYRKVLITFAVLFIFFLVVSYFAATSITNRIFNDAVIKQSENDLRQANVTKGKFIKILAHDLKNPITSIQAFSEILASDNDDFSNAQRKNFSKLIRNSTQVMLQLIEDVLSWSKAQSGELKIQKENIELDDVVYYALSLLQIQAEKKEIVLNTDLQEHVHIYADPNMIVTVIRNIVSNAIKFSHRESTVDINVREDAENITLSIRDYGVGIPEDKIPLLFNAGEKNYSKGTENESGTGLGLILCKEFLDKNNGELSVTSELNKGTIFTLSFLKVEN